MATQVLVLVVSQLCSALDALDPLEWEGGENGRNSAAVEMPVKDQGPLELKWSVLAMIAEVQVAAAHQIGLGTEHDGVVQMEGACFAVGQAVAAKALVLGVS